MNFPFMHIVTFLFFQRLTLFIICTVENTLFYIKIYDNIASHTNKHLDISGRIAYFNMY